MQGLADLRYEMAALSDFSGDVLGFEAHSRGDKKLLGVSLLWEKSDYVRVCLKSVSLEELHYGHGRTEAALIMSD